MYKLPRWKEINRKRETNISYSDPRYVKYYDLDIEDFKNLVIKLHNNNILSPPENDRYGVYLYTICYIVLEGPKFKRKLASERAELIEAALYELLLNLSNFDPNKGKIYSYAYRIAYTSMCHFYTNKIKQEKREKLIQEHCNEEYQIYKDELNLNEETDESISSTDGFICLSDILE